MTEESMLSLKIDGKEIKAAKGTTILRAALDNGIEIPHLCYHPKLKIRGSCRVCLVEVEGRPKLETACSTTIGDDMVVFIDSEKVKKARQGVLEFLLINHPLNCPVCDQAGDCELQNYVRKYGRKHSRYTEDKREYPKVDIGGGIVRDMNLCVACTRCIRFARDILGIEEYGTYFRGNDQEIGIYGGGELKNAMQGCMVDICPVGALTSRDFRFKQRVWFLDPRPSVCLRCAKGCNTYIDVKEKNIFRIRPRENPDINDVWMCDIGRLVYHDMDDVEPVLSPMMKVGGKLKEISWDTAKGELSSRIRDAKEGGFALIVGAGASLEGMASALLMAEEYTKNISYATRLEDVAEQKRWGNFLISEEYAPNGAGAKKLGIRDITKDINSKIKDGKIDVVLFIGCNIFDEGLPISHLPDLKKVRFKAVFSDRLTPEIKNTIDLIIPAPHWGGVSGTYINMDGISQKIEAAISPPEGVIPITKALAEVASSLKEVPVDYKEFSEKIEGRIG